MLASLTINNVVLIDHLLVEFDKGLCALTGETGAGKSILLDSLGLALGSRANSGLVRKGTDQASVIAVFELDENHIVFNFLKSHDIPIETPLIFRRQLTSDGRSKAFINDQVVTANLLKQAAAMLVEIHGQFDTQSLFDVSTHIDFLDAFGGYASLMKDVQKSWEEWKIAQEQRNILQSHIDTIREEEEYIKQSLEDLDALNPEAGEEEKLTLLKQALKNSVQITENVTTAQSGLDELQNITATIWRSLENLGEQGIRAIEAMDRAQAELQETSSALTDMMHDIENGGHNLEDIDERLYSLKTQARKHGCSIDDLAAKRNELADKLSSIENIDSKLADAIKAEITAKKTYGEQAEKLSTKRKASASKLQKRVMDELPSLKLDKARFEISQEKMDEKNWSIKGVDSVAFLIATNPGQEAGALNKIASGGELARFTLALKVALADTGVSTSLVFDEVDSGIGGATAAAVGDRLAALSSFKQILVVTHSPQVAARADNQWIVHKDGTKEVKTSITRLNETDKRQEEIARMLSGAEITPEARAAAARLLEKKAA